MGYDSDVPVRHDSNPARLASVARAQPDIVLACPSDFDREVRSEPIAVGRLGVKPLSQVREAHLGVLGGDSPF